MSEAMIRSPDERAVRAHLQSARFQSGVDDGRWRLISLDWPHALIAVSAAARPNAPHEYVLRFDLAGYPQRGPTAALWDETAGTVAGPSTRPKGDRASMIFRGDWNGGVALYAPWDRVALDSHPDWAQRFPQFAWHSSRDLTFYLTNVCGVLNDDTYSGV